MLQSWLFPVLERFELATAGTFWASQNNDQLHIQDEVRQAKKPRAILFCQDFRYSDAEGVFRSGIVVVLVLYLRII